MRALGVGRRRGQLFPPCISAAPSTHGTNAPSTIGGHLGCIRVNEDVIDLYGRVNVGTKVIVLPMEHCVDTGRGARG
jgi:hypothetical protein